MTTREIFETMDYGPAPESDTEARAWIAGKGPAFGAFIDGVFAKPGETFATRNPATGAELARITQSSTEDVDKAVAAARRAFPGWSKLSGHQRARHLYALARLLQKHARLFAVLETLDNGKPIREARDIDVPRAPRPLKKHPRLAP
ncbi:MAG: aldehyde dehydrogenase family protein, partial [Roseicyclus sp.]|nr:aldehyde dehydrogenase family protein [Roseicyclus sp.]